MFESDLYDEIVFVNLVFGDIHVRNNIINQNNTRAYLYERIHHILRV